MARLALFLGIGCIIALEIGLRMIAGLGDPPLVSRDTKVEYRLVPSASYQRFGNRIDINAVGMRGPDFDPEAKENERRIMLIGDSVIYGNHFLDQSDTISFQMTHRLGGTPQLHGCEAMVMAAAASSWGPVNQAAFVADVGPLDAKLAMVVLSSHDLYDTPTFQDAVIPYRLKPSFGAIHDAVQIVVERLKKRWADPVPQPSILDRQESTLLALDQLSQQMRDENIALVLVYHPTVIEIANGVLPEHDVLANWAQRQGIQFETLRSDALNANAYRDVIHPNAQGAAEIARLLIEMSQDLITPCNG